MKKVMLILTTLLIAVLAQTITQAKERNMENQKTLRLLMPEWQAGDYDLSVRTGELYPLGGRILEFIAPKSDAELVEVPIQPYEPGLQRRKENGVINQGVVLKQMRVARDILEKKAPDRVVTFGGECQVSQAPFDYMNGRYKGNLGILWIDAHPDVSTPEFADREHAMILGNLLGGGDPVFANDVKNPFKPEQVMLIGISEYNHPQEGELVKQFGLPVLKPDDVAENSDKVMKWIRDNKFDNIAIHLDLDSLDPRVFYSQFPNDPDAKKKFPTALGKLNFKQLNRLLSDISKNSNIVCFTIAEPMPWDAYNLRNMMEQIDIMN